MIEETALPPVQNPRKTRWDDEAKKRWWAEQRQVPGRIYDGDYYLRGQETGKSLYTDYTWHPELTLPMCERIAEHCGIKPGDDILDFGCARGYVVRAFRELGFRATGIDISEWAIANCDPAVREHVHCTSTFFLADWIIAKDVLEHLGDNELREAIRCFYSSADKGIFIVVPLSGHNGGPYVVPEYERDITHEQRLNLDGWTDLLVSMAPPGWIVSGTCRVQGIKENYAHYPLGNGFLRCASGAA